jgi:hypothetical protein
MSMYLRYGNYVHDANECVIGISRHTQETPGGQPYEIAETWSIEGVILPSSGGGMTSILAKKRLMESAYSAWFKDIVFYSDAGLEAHAMRNAMSARGVKVLVPPSFPADSGASLVTGLRYMIQVQAEFPVLNAAGLIKSFSETITTRPGGSAYQLATTVNRPAVRFRSTAFMPWRASQSGQAVGYLQKPFIPPPLWPAALIGEPLGVFSNQSPQFHGGRFQDYAVSWQYEFGSPTPLIGEPNRQPTG